MNKKEILFTFEPTVDDGILVSSKLITDDMLYRQHYKNESTHVFVGEKYNVYCLLNMSVNVSREKALSVVTSMVSRFSE